MEIANSPYSLSRWLVGIQRHATMYSIFNWSSFATCFRDHCRKKRDYVASSSYVIAWYNWHKKCSWKKGLMLANSASSPIRSETNSLHPSAMLLSLFSCAARPNKSWSNIFSETSVMVLTVHTSTAKCAFKNLSSGMHFREDVFSVIVFTGYMWTKLCYHVTSWCDRSLGQIPSCLFISKTILCDSYYCHDHFTNFIQLDVERQFTWIKLWQTMYSIFRMSNRQKIYTDFFLRRNKVYVRPCCGK